jgi:indolepyruvate ferredoxin oxidoreductase alpha subunit
MSTATHETDAAAAPTAPERLLMSGNEAIARGTWEAGATLAAAYPGTPSTEILEAIRAYDGIHAQWSPNEKVALEVAIGASFCGARALAVMKHVGVNVAADPLMTLSYTGVRGGLVLVSADDPGIHSSQNEQDNRRYGEFAKIPVLEPSDSQEAKDLVGTAFALSEEFDTPVMLRSTTRISHSESLVTLEDRSVPDRPIRFDKDFRKFVMVPANARRRHVVVEDRVRRLAEWAETAPVNRWERGSSRIGIVSSGIAYQYAREAAPDASFLKLGMTYPLPMQLIRSFAESVDEVWVIEELDPFLEEKIRPVVPGIRAKDPALRVGELNVERVEDILAGRAPEPAAAPELPPRPPVLCPGCPHRAVFHILRKLRAVVVGDIGCYTLGALPPLNALDTCVCMGASVSGLLGFTKVLPEEQRRKTVAVIGDSTFVHSGITGLVDNVYNQGTGTILIMDNETTAMTGIQDHPGTGTTLKGEKTRRLDYVKLGESLGIEHIKVFDPYDMENAEQVLREAMQRDDISLLVSQRACALMVRMDEPSVHINQEVCKVCGACVRLGCPAIHQEDAEDGKGMITVNEALCRGCRVCEQVCKFDAITVGGDIRTL